MRVLHVITGLGTGGAEQQLRLLLRSLPVDCDVVTLTEPGAVAAGLTSDGVHVVHLGMTGNRDLSALPRLVRLIRDGGYDLVHTHLYRACLYGRVAARLAGVRAVVATEHSLGDTRMEGRPLTGGVRALYLAGERLGSITVAVSPTVAGRLRRWGVPAPRIEVVPNGIDLDRFRFDPVRRRRTRHRLGLPDEAYVVGGIGRLVPGKRFDVLVRALARLPQDYWLLLVGGGPEEHSLRGIAREAGVADRVLLTGERPYLPGGTPGPDLPSLTSAMDVLASPSPEEAFGLAAVEGLASGLPVLYASCPAIEDLPPHTAPSARRVQGEEGEFARALAEVRAAGPAPRDHPPEAARHYCITRSAAQLMDVYAAVLTPRAGPVIRTPGSQFRMTESRTQHRSGSRTETVTGDRADGRAPALRGPAAALARAGARVRDRARSRPASSVLVVGVLAGALAGGGYGLVRTPQYTATSYVVAVPAKGSDPASALGFAQAYGRVASQLAVLGDAQVWAGVPAATLKESVRTATSPDAPMVAVTATSARPDVAADMANAVSRALTRHAADTTDATRVGLRQFARATEPAEPSSLSAGLTGLIGASAGGLLGALGLLVRPRRAADGSGRPAAVPGPSSAPPTAPPSPSVPAADVRGQL